MFLLLQPTAQQPRRAPAWLLLLALLSALAALRPPAAPAVPPARIAPAALAALGQLPLAFVPNAGQADPDTVFQTQALGGSVALDAGGVALALPSAGARPAALRVAFVGARPGVAVEGHEPQPGVVNIYQGSDPARWRAGLPTYAAVVYRGLYPGVDLRYDGASARLKGTYELAAGADPAAIRWRYDGAGRVRLDPASGDLLIALAGRPHSLAERAPVAWQDVAGQRRAVPVRYRLASDGSVGFALGAYDPALPLTIDPTLEYSSYLGGAGQDRLSAVALDAEGNIVVSGTTASSDFPTAPAATPDQGRVDDTVFVTKLNAAGNRLIFSTLFGGGGRDLGRGASLDSGGRIAVVGETQSADMPAVAGLDQTLGGTADAFAAVFSPEGRLEFSTYLGGTANESGQDVAFDSERALVVVGSTASADFPTERPRQADIAGNEDLFVTKISPDRRSFVFSTYFGGALLDKPSAVAVDRSNAIVIAGLTESADLPIGAAALQPDYKGDTDGFVIGLDPSGASLRFGTYLGGAAVDAVEDVALDQAGAVYLAGWTFSADFPVAGALQPLPAEPESRDGFAASLSADGTSLRFSTYLGGSADDRAYAVAVAADGAVVVAGDTLSDDFPLAEAVQASPGGGRDAFVSSIRPDGAALRFSTYLGGSKDETTPRLAVDPQSTIVVAGTTASDDLPTLRPLQPQPAAASGSDTFLARIGSPAQLRLTAAGPAEALPCATPESCARSPLSFAVTLEALNRPSPASLTVQVPDGLSVIETSLPPGASYDRLERRVRFSAGLLAPGAPLTVGYRATLSPDVLPGTLLTSRAVAQGSEQDTWAALPLAVADTDFAGTLVVIYASGDNDLAEAIQQLPAKVARGSANPAVRTLLLVDGPGASAPLLYRLGPGAERCPNPTAGECAGVERWSWPGEQLADPQNLSAFLTGALRSHPNASRRVLSLVGHGGGWSPPVLEGQPSRHGGQPGSDGLGGMLWDNQPEPGGTLSTPELGQALREATAAGGEKFDLLFLDACSMAMAEVAYEVRGGAHFLLASANWKWAGFPYDQHIPSAVGDGRAIGEAWLRQEAGYLTRWGDPFTYALIDLSQMQPLRSATDALAEALMRPGGPLASAEGRQRLLAAAAAADRFDSNSDGAIRVGSSRADADYYVDLGSLADGLAEAFGPDDPAVALAARHLSAAADDAVVASEVLSGTPWFRLDQDWAWSPAAALSIYLPLHYDDWRQRYYGLIQYSADGRWDELIGSYWRSPAAPVLRHIPPADPSCPPDCGLPFAQPPVRTQIHLPLVSSQAPAARQ